VDRSGGGHCGWIRPGDPPRIHALLLSIPMRISPSYSWEFGWGRRICRIGFRVYGLIAVSPLTERNVYWFVSLSFCRSIWGISSPNWMNVLWIELSNSVMESGFPRLSRIFNSASTESLIGSIFLCLLALLGHVFFSSTNYALRISNFTSSGLCHLIFISWNLKLDYLIART
jgi:hypothetical protein